MTVQPSDCRQFWSLRAEGDRRTGGSTTWIALGSGEVRTQSSSVSSAAPTPAPSSAMSAQSIRTRPVGCDRTGACGALSIVVTEAKAVGLPAEAIVDSAFAVAAKAGPMAEEARSTIEVYIRTPRKSSKNRRIP